MCAFISLSQLVLQSHYSGDGGYRLWQPVQADSKPKSFGLFLGRRPLGAVLRSSTEPGGLSQWLCHDDSTINIVLELLLIISTVNFTPFRHMSPINSTLYPYLCSQNARHIFDLRIFLNAIAFNVVPHSICSDGPPMSPGQGATVFVELLRASL